MAGRFLSLCIMLVLLLCASATAASDLTRYATSDMRVLYIYDDPGDIDWPTLFLLNGRDGCRIDLLRLQSSRSFSAISGRLEERRLYRWNIFVADPGSTSLDSAIAAVFSERRSDIVILGSQVPSELARAAFEKISTLPPDPGSLFNILKSYIYTDTSAAAAGVVSLNTEALLSQYWERMRLDIPRLFPNYDLDSWQHQRLTRYAARTVAAGIDRSAPDITTGLTPLRLDRVLDSIMADGQVKGALVGRARNYVSLFTVSRGLVGLKRVESIVQGYKELVQLEYQCQSQSTLSQNGELTAYLNRLVQRARAVTLSEMGLDWDGDIIIRESPHGPKVKFKARVSVNGPKEVELSYVRFHPYWSSEVVVLDSVSRKIEPHQSYVREYLVEVDQQYLESTRPESLSFSAEIVYSRIPLEVRSSIPLRETPQLAISFQPPFHFVPPSARLNIDKVVSAMNWKVRIDKPRSYTGLVKIDLATPVGVFAGAYKQEVELETGRTNEVITIPFSVSNLFELGIHRQTVNLLIDNQVVASDTGIIRVASCKVDDTIQIAFLPDSSGELEDILRLSGVGYRALTDRGLWTADLDAYKVIVVGSGAAGNYPSLAAAKSRLVDYIRFGGSLVIFGQPSDWPRDVLPVSFAPGLEPIGPDDITNRIPKAIVLSQPYKIDVGDLLADLPPIAASSAVITPSEKVLVTPSGATLLSVSRLGEGQIIYCGLPLTDLVSGLNLEAIHLFANLLNY